MTDQKSKDLTMGNIVSNDHTDKLISRRELLQKGIATTIAFSILSFEAPKESVSQTNARRGNRRPLRDVLPECNPGLYGDVDCQQCMAAIATSTLGPVFTAFVASVAANIGLPGPPAPIPDSTAYTCAISSEPSCSHMPNSPHKKRDVLVTYLLCVYNNIEESAAMSLGYLWLEYLRTH